ncbi:MAG TPA: glycosyltransferase family 39 protein [Verrucomicrobiae bacterium]|nr:glycosyltransferase family 39 protein [Verrucomicrobiae bacterium]
MVTLQDLIHHLEVGEGMRSFNRVMRIVSCVFAVLILVAAYDLRAYRNFSTQEAMDSAQLARNIAEGKGYSTLFVRPLSIYLLQQRQGLSGGESTNNPAPADAARLKGPHPDLANPPAYPVLLAGLMKVLPFRYAIPSKPRKFWSFQGKFYRYQPDFIIALCNQVLLMGLVVSAFFMARRLFDANVAWVSAIVLMGTEMLWRFSVSGLSTILLLLVFMALIWCLVLFEEETRQPKWTRGGLFLLAALAGVLVGVGGLTRYAFGVLIIPVLLFVLIYSPRTRALLGACAVAGFALVILPWVLRTYSLSGMPFGTANYALIENSFVSPEDRLERSINPELLRSVHNSLPFLTAAYHVFPQKLVANSRAILQNDLPRLAGTWVSAFFLVGLLVKFRSPTLSKLRMFLVSALIILVATQALGRTKLSEDSPDINSENLLILAAPLVVMYGVALFFIVLDQLELPFLQMRSVVISVFGSIACLPLILTILPPKISPLVYPPYYPPSIQSAVGWTKEDELMMSDVPWAVAWYGQSQCISLSSNARVEFFSINDYLKPISALYLTSQTVDRWTQSGDWGNLFLQTIRVLPGDNSKYPLHVALTLPQGGSAPPIPFPLQYLQAGWPMQLLFTYRQHWPTSE